MRKYSVFFVMVAASLILAGCSGLGNFVHNVATGGDGGVYIFMDGGKVTYVGSGNLAARIKVGQTMGRGTSAKVILRVNPNMTANPGGVEDAAEQVAIDYYRSIGMPLKNTGTALAKSNRYYQTDMDAFNQYMQDSGGWKPGTSPDPLDWNYYEAIDIPMPDTAAIPADFPDFPDEVIP